MEEELDEVESLELIEEETLVSELELESVSELEEEGKRDTQLERRTLVNKRESVMFFFIMSLCTGVDGVYRCLSINLTNPFGMVNIRIAITLFCINTIIARSCPIRDGILNRP
jgi:hypothetical protein